MLSDCWAIVTPFWRAIKLTVYGPLPCQCQLETSTLASLWGESVLLVLIQFQVPPSTCQNMSYWEASRPETAALKGCVPLTWAPLVGHHAFTWLESAVALNATVPL